MTRGRHHRRIGAVAVVAALVCAPGATSHAQDQKKGGRPVWMDPETAAREPDFVVQGEYVTTGLGAQVIALGDGHFQAVMLPGGLPGAGWDGASKVLLQGRRQGRTAAFEPAAGPRRYLDGDPKKFSATSTFPPKTQRAWRATIQGGVMTVVTGRRTMRLKKAARRSPTLARPPPRDAIVLFDGKIGEEIEGGVVTKWGHLHTGPGGQVVSKRRFGSYTLHVEFMTCFSPFNRGQSRGNSGCFQMNGTEVQVLDSFGLDGKANECGGIYKWRPPKVNMAFPPLGWQTYDIEFVAPEGGVPARMTVKHNGVVIHERLEMKGNNKTSGQVRFQRHGDWVQYRNMWIVDRKPDLDPKTDDA